MLQADRAVVLVRQVDSLVVDFGASMNCVSKAWLSHEKELRAFIYTRIKEPQLTEDLLQDVFIKALAEGAQFCDLDNTRAWLFRVLKNRMIDYQRTAKIYDDVPDHLTEESQEEAPVNNLAVCLPVALKKMDSEDADIIQQCDLNGLNQADYAKYNELSLSATKSRLQRARKRLKIELQNTCNVRFDEQGNVCCFGGEINT